MIFVAILIGTSVSNFIVDLLQYSTQVKYIKVIQNCYLYLKLDIIINEY